MWESGSVSCSVVSYSSTSWTVACQVPLSVEFSRQEYWSGKPFSSPGNLTDPGIEPKSPELQTESSPSEPPGKPLVWGKQWQLTEDHGPTVLLGTVFFVCLFNLLAVLGLYCYVGFSLVVVSRGCSLVAVVGLLIAVASLVAVPGL